jgi:hypothetical protein
MVEYYAHIRRINKGYRHTWGWTGTEKDSSSLVVLGEVCKFLHPVFNSMRDVGTTIHCTPSNIKLNSMQFEKKEGHTEVALFAEEWNPMHKLREIKGRNYRPA